MVSSKAGHIKLRGDLYQDNSGSSREVYFLQIRPRDLQVCVYVFVRERERVRT